ncbi:uncharacterized protein LOC135837561 [Planococcus citri]|uniref:uncharacterized protein LOC135837561 n=1 Tax=Planococcus citri TaxID=170843 RepID=UPI0031F749A5
MGDIEEYPFLFMNTPSSLQILASTEVALTLWQSRCAASDHSYENFGSFLWVNQVFSCEELLVGWIPPQIRSQIDDKITTVGEELRGWRCFHGSVFKSEKAFFKCIKHIVLDFSGTIGYKATAMNILDSGEFADLENYKMACLYCLEDQVRRFWPLVTTDVNLNHGTCNLRYWHDFMILGQENPRSRRPSVPFRERWIQFANWKNDRTAFEHFYQMLPARETVDQTVYYLRDSKYQAAIRSLPTLNRIQVEEIFKRKASTMFGILARNDEVYFSQYAYQSWTLVRHLILENEETFFSVVYILWRIAFCPKTLGVSHTRCHKINKLLLEIWSDASDELKAAVSNNHINEFFDEDFNEFGSDYFHYHGHDMKFTIDLLNISRDVDKVSLWVDNWRGFALRAKLSDFKRLMRSCSVFNEDDVEFYKIRLLDFEDFFPTLIKNGFYSDLKDYLYFCSTDEEHFQLLAKKELESNLDIIIRHDNGQFAKFEWFVGKLFSNKKKDADGFKAQMISSAESFKHLLKARNDRQIRSYDFSTLIGRFATEEDESNLVKRNLLEHWRSYPMNCRRRIVYFDEWIEFLEWCIPDYEEHSAFKRSLNVDEVFLKLLNDNAMGMGMSISDEVSLDDILRWYFGNEEDRKNFKVDIIKKNYTRMDFMYTKMLSDDDLDRRVVSSYLRWFFDNNTERLCKFCENCKFILHPDVPYEYAGGETRYNEFFSSLIR